MKQSSIKGAVAFSEKPLFAIYSSFLRFADLLADLLVDLVVISFAEDRFQPL